MKLHWPAPERNKQPILEVLQRVLPSHGTLLEIASGTGQHAVYFAQAMPGWTWIPSEVPPAQLASIEAYRNEAALPNLAAARAIDVCQVDWPIARSVVRSEIDAIFNANMIHIAPWQCCEGLLAGAGKYLGAGGHLILYGPMRIGGEHTSESNAEFDDDLRQRDARWGVRDLEQVVSSAEHHGFRFRQRMAMPANNQCLHFERV